MRNPKFDARPQSLTKLFESMDILSKDLIKAIMNQRTCSDIYWHDVGQSISDLQDLIIYFQHKIKHITLEELSCKTICLFEDYTQKFIDRKIVYISKEPNNTRNDYYVETRENANNTAALLQNTVRDLKKHFEQLVYKKICAEKKYTEVDGTEYC